MEKQEKEILLNTIDALTMDVLRLKSENDVLRSRMANNSGLKKKKTNYDTIWNKGFNYLKREGFFPTIKKMIKKVFNLEG
ncbi:hypothetical protein KQH27_01165 [bacterium]|nr:hypothetical protein [bacterium]